MATYDLTISLPAGATFRRESTAYAQIQSGGELVLHALNQPRFQFSNGLRAYLVEPGFVNIDANPEDFTLWTHVNDPVVVDANVGAAPDGVLTADRLRFQGAGPDQGIKQAVAGQTNGTIFMLSLYVQADTAPNDYRLESAVGAGPFTDGVASAVWQRSSYLATVVGGEVGMNIRRLAGVGGALRLWGACYYVDDHGNVYEYHPTTKAPDVLAIPNTDVGSLQGTIELAWIPKFALVFGAQSNGVIFDASSSAFQLDYVASTNPPLLTLLNGGATIATLAPLNLSVGDELRIKIHYGGTPTRPHLVVNGWGVAGTSGWSPPPIRSSVYIGCDSTGARQNWARFRQVSVSSVRTIYPRRVGLLGDSLSDSGLSGTWGRQIGSRIESAGYVLCAGIGGQRLAQMAARVQSDIIDQGMNECVVLGGVNDAASDRSFFQMRTDAENIYVQLRSAGIRIIACTILPFKGSGSWSAEREVARSGFNSWLLLGQAPVDYVVNTAAVVADPTDPLQYLAVYDSGDHVHYSTAGGIVLGNAVADLLLGLSAPVAPPPPPPPTPGGQGGGTSHWNL